MYVTRHPQLAEDIRNVALHYAEISERVLSSFWRELEVILASIERNPRSHHFDTSGLRRANLKRFPYHILYEVDDHSIYLLVLRHDRRHPEFGLDRISN
jgi:plasmid stabilization system protein ParE